MRKAILSIFFPRDTWNEKRIRLFVKVGLGIKFDQKRLTSVRGRARGRPVGPTYYNYRLASKPTLEEWGDTLEVESKVFEMPDEELLVETLP